MTRATLLSDPFKNRNGQWWASARLDQKPPLHVTVELAEEHADLRAGDTIRVQRDQAEWKAA